MLQYVHHVHYVVHNRDAMVEYLEKTFGMKPDKLVVYEDRGMKDALYDVGQSHIQITEPLDPNSDIASTLPSMAPGCITWRGVSTISARWPRISRRRGTKCAATTALPPVRAGI